MYKLKEMEVSENYQYLLNKEIVLIKDNHLLSLNHLWDKFKSAIFKAVNRACGSIIKTNRKKQTHCIDGIKILIVREKKRLWKKYLNDSKLETFDEYMKQNKKVKTVVREAKREE